MEIVKFPGRQGLILSGRLHLPAGVRQDRPILIICHGFRGGMDGHGRAAGLAGKAAGMGIAALRFDFSGTGESEGDFADTSLSSYLLDLAGAVEFAQSVTKGPILILGRSFGGTAALMFASRNPGVAAVCTWAAPVDLEETFVRLARPLLDEGDEVLKIPEGDGYYLLKRSFFDDLLQYDVLTAAGKISPRPILVVHGTADETVDFNQGMKLFEAAREPKSRLFVDGADHIFLRHYDEVEGETLKWIYNYLH